MLKKSRKPPISEKDALKAELIQLRCSLGLLRRRQRYMYRNTDNAYSMQDLLLAQFALDTTHLLIQRLELDVEECDEKDKADLRYTQRCRLAELRELDALVIEDKRTSVQLQEGDARDMVIELEDLEFKEIEWKFTSKAFDADRHDRMAAERAKVRDARPRFFAFVKWGEQAMREDIVSGEREDFSVLKGCFMTTRPCRLTQV